MLILSRKTNESIVIDGRIKVKIDQTNREVAAKSRDGQAMGTHDRVFIVEAREDFVIVVPYREN